MTPPTQGEHAQPEALRLADWLDLYAPGDPHRREIEEAAVELRSLHALTLELADQLSGAKDQVAALTAAPQGGAYAELHQRVEELIEKESELRRVVEIIALGESANPVMDAGDELVALGYWDAGAVAALRASHGQAPAGATVRTSFDDPRVQTAYAILCDDQEPPKGEHWEGFAARRIVEALFPTAQPAPAATPQADSVTAPASGANWQDISTAPKDGTRFVAVGNNYGLYSETQHTCIAQWFRDCWMEASDWNETSELKYLTHWMPLLPLPGSAEMRTQQTIEQQEIALLTDEELCQIEEPHLVNFRIPLGGQYDFARDVEKAVLAKTQGMQDTTPPAQAADSVLEDAARWQYLRDERDVALCVMFFGNGCINMTMADVIKAIDAKIAARKQGANHD